MLFLLELFSCSKDKSIHVTDLNTGALQRDISQAHGYGWLFFLFIANRSVNSFLTEALII